MKNDNAMQACIEACRACHDACQAALFTHCLQEGGEHAAPEHVKLMTDCIAICQQAADFMARESKEHALVCEVCAHICGVCADSCEKIGGEHMKRCADACLRCADSCRKMRRAEVAAA